jgi:hypothetical protein
MRSKTRLLLATTVAALWLASPRSASSAEPAVAPVPAPVGAPVTVTVTNPLPAARTSETIAISRAELVKLAPAFDLQKAEVVDAAGHPVLSQLVDLDADGAPDELVFQTDLAAHQQKAFQVRAGKRSLAARADFKVYGRFVRERHDDFAWENDLVAHRVYGPGLETWAKEPLVSSGIDTWVKRVPRLIVNDWYMTDDYHHESGEGADLYSVGKSRGCGGVGIWAGGKLVPSRNFTTSRVLASGPIRLVFELAFAPWEVAKGVRVSETKRVTLDAGTFFNRIESTFTVAGKAPAPLLAGIGIAKHAGSAVEVDAPSVSMRAYEPLKGPNGEASGNLGCAIVLPAGAPVDAHHSDLDYLVVTPVPPGGKLVYQAGTAWSKAGRVPDAAAWGREVQGLAARLAAPVTIALSAAKDK